MKKVLPVLLVLVIALSMASCISFSPQPAVAATTATPAATSTPAAADQITLPRAADGEFKTPEDTLNYFVDGIKNNDFLTATKAFAIYEVPEHLDYKAFADWEKTTYMLSGMMPESYQGLNFAAMLGRAETCYKSAVLCLSGIDPTQIIVQNTAGDTANFIASTSPDKLSGTTMVAQDMASTLSADAKDKYTANMAAMAKAFGARRLPHLRRGRLRLDGNKADCDTFMLLKYGGNWYCAGCHVYDSELIESTQAAKRLPFWRVFFIWRSSCVLNFLCPARVSSRYNARRKEND